MKIENRIQIAAPPERVWQVTTDLNGWPRWMPTIESIRRLDDGEFRLGTSAEIKQPGLRLATWTVTKLTAGESFIWETHFRGLHMWATHVITASGVGSESLLRLEMRGLVTWLFWPVIRYSTANALTVENLGLKEFCETLP